MTLLRVLVAALMATVWLPALAGAFESSTVLRYRGRFFPADEPAAEASKNFEIVYLLPEADRGWAWLLREDGAARWAWPFQIGRTDAAESPAIAFAHAVGRRGIPLPEPVFQPRRPLTDGASWTAGDFTYRIAAVEDDETLWRVAARHRHSRHRQLLVRRASRLIVRFEATVFLGQGEQHTLVLELADQEQFEPADETATREALAAFRSVRGKLWDRAELDARWTEARRAIARDSLPRLRKLAAGTLLAQVADEAEQSLATETDSAATLAEMQKARVGKPLPAIRLYRNPGEKPDTPESLRGKTTVLHFWSYKHPPEEAPYGQVGYLDFLARKFGQKVAIYGVVANKELIDPEPAGRVRANARKLQRFMNLSYALRFDPGAALNKLGDPRRAGGKLPLTVVVDPDGVVRHFHVGLYDANPREGLKALQTAIEATLE